MKNYQPTRLFFGENCVQDNAEALRLGNHALIVTSAHAARACGALDDVMAALKKSEIAYTVFDGISPNPKLSDCFKAAKTSADFVIGVGGGSPMDAAKAIAVLLKNPHFDEERLYAGNLSAVPIVCVGTTAGTGSEVTAVAVMTNKQNRKKSLHEDCLFPTVSFADPRYTESLPDGITRATAIDALAHCIESYFSKAAGDISQTYALRGIQILLQQFEKYDGAPQKEDRAQLSLAALYGGLAIAVTGTAFPHAFGYFLSEDHALPHGVACGVFLPAFLAHNRSVCPSLCQTFYERLGTTETSLLKLIQKMMPQGKPAVTAEEIESLRPRWSHNATLQKTRGDITPDAATEILRNVLL